MVASVTCATDGRFAFAGLARGDDTVDETDPTGYSSITSNSMAPTVTAAATLPFGDAVYDAVASSNITAVPVCDRDLKLSLAVLPALTGLQAARRRPRRRAG